MRDVALDQATRVGNAEAEDAWRNGTTYLAMLPPEFIQRLAMRVP